MEQKYGRAPKYILAYDFYNRRPRPKVGQISICGHRILNFLNFYTFPQNRAVPGPFLPLISMQNPFSKILNKSRDMGTWSKIGRYKVFVHRTSLEAGTWS